jgi:hypothetical protein
VIANKRLTMSGSRSDEAGEVQDIVLPAGIAGTLTTRTDANTGIVTVASGHGITDSDTLCVFFADGSQYAVDVTATTSTTISIDAGLGTDLPAASSAVVISKQVVSTLVVSGSSIAAWGLSNPTRVRAQFKATATVTLTSDIAAEEGLAWVSGIYTNPLAGASITTLVLANGETTESTVGFALLKNSV